MPVAPASSLNNITKGPWWCNLGDARLRKVQACLEESQWLNDDVIGAHIEILAACTPRLRSVESLIFPHLESESDQCLLEVRRKILSHAVEIESLRLMTVYQPTDGHWACIWFEVSAKKATFVDSSSTPLATERARRHAVVFVSRVLPEPYNVWDDGSWSFEQAQWIRQTNADDCGVYALCAAYHLAAAIKLPCQLHVRAWRWFLRSVLVPSPEPIPRPGPGPGPEPTSDLLPAPENKFEITQQQQDPLEALSPQTDQRQTPKSLTLDGVLGLLSFATSVAAELCDKIVTRREVAKSTKAAVEAIINLGRTVERGSEQAKRDQATEMEVLTKSESLRAEALSALSSPDLKLKYDDDDQAVALLKASRSLSNKCKQALLRRQDCLQFGLERLESFVKGPARDEAVAIGKREQEYEAELDRLRPELQACELRLVKARQMG